MKKTICLLMSCMFVMTLASCYCDKIYVGDITPYDEVVHVESARNGHYLEGAVVTKNNVRQYIGDTKDYIIETKHTFGDMILTGVTLGIYSPTTTKYYVKKDNPKVVVLKKKKGSKAYKGYLKR